MEQQNHGTTSNADTVVFEKPPTRIEKLGELYDNAIERVKERSEPSGAYPTKWEQDRVRAAHTVDMQIITTYLQETKRPERESIGVPGPQPPRMLMQTEEGTFALSDNAQWILQTSTAKL